MLKSIQVDGLKSLNDFRLELRTGLNVLIGPNGAGKSNILNAIDLIANITHLDLLNGKRFSGTTEIAQLFDIYRKNKKISLALEGETETFFCDALPYEKKRERRIKLSYKIEFEIIYRPQNAQKLLFSKQSLDLGVSFEGSKKLHKFKLDFNGSKSRVIACDEIFLGNMTKNLAVESTSVFAPDIIETILNRGEFLNYRSIVEEFSLMFSPLKSVLSEMESGISYNIDPTSIRDNFGNLVAPTIEQDGNGLQSVLLEICEKIYKSKHTQFGSVELYDNYQDIYETIVFHLRQFLPKLIDLRVGFDRRKNKILGDLIYENKAKLPIELMSDGSLKLLTLVTLLLTKKHLIALEEPENYLQPKMQQQIIELMRDTVGNQNESRLFTTHCETIVNLLKPEEIIYTKYENGRTQAGRFRDPDKLRNAIRESGAGLGWYYVTRALDNRHLV